MNVGVDIEDVQRFKKMIERKPSLLQKFFSDYEWEYAVHKNTAQTLCGIWCAKEAVVKALSEHHSLLVTDVMITHNERGAPIVMSIKGVDHKENYQIKISVSHTKDYAVATCTALFSNL